MLVGVGKPREDHLIPRPNPQFFSRFGVSEWDATLLTGLRAPRRRALTRVLRDTHHQLVASSGLLSFGESEFERHRIGAEVLRELGGRALLLRPRKALLEETDLLPSFLTSLGRELGELELWVDPGADYPSRLAEKSGSPSIHWIADPLWHPRSAWSRANVLKCHGWHEARWIRYYGPTQLKLIRKRASRAEVLLFGHSKREEEAITLIPV